MKMKRTTRQVPLGRTANVSKSAYELHLDALIHSTGNPKSKKGKYARGGGFLVFHQHDEYRPRSVPEVTALGLTFGGETLPIGYHAVNPANPLLPTWNNENGALTPLGATGWKRARPGGAAASLSQFIIEAREAPKLLPSFLKGPLKGLGRRAMQAVFSMKQLGSAYLNVNFGWKPMLADLRKMHELQQTLDKRLGDLRRNNGKNLRRERTLKDSTVTSVSESSTDAAFGYIDPTPILGLTTGKSRLTTIVTTKEKVWFVGQFRYYVPDIGSDQWTRRATQALKGNNITPSVLWEVMPWSWLVDWFSNVGDVIDNASSNAVDNTVSNYAFIMREIVTTTSLVASLSWDARETSPEIQAGSAEPSIKTEVIKRARSVATPYGFGITYDGLSPYQQSILAALAISRKSFL